MVSMLAAAVIALSVALMTSMGSRVAPQEAGVAPVAKTSPTPVVGVPTAADTPESEGRPDSSKESTKPEWALPDDEPSTEPVAEPSTEPVESLPEWTPPEGAPATEAEYSEPVCPGTYLASHISSIEYESAEYEGEYEGEYYVHATGRLVNETPYPIVIYLDLVPTVEGLIPDGTSAVSVDKGEYEWKPANGKPRPSQVEIQPGQEFPFTSRSNFPSHVESLQEVTHWYTGTESVYYSNYASQDSPDCSPTNDVGEGESIPVSVFPPPPE